MTTNTDPVAALSAVRDPQRRVAAAAAAIKEAHDARQQLNRTRDALILAGVDRFSAPPVCRVRLAAAPPGTPIAGRTPVPAPAGEPCPGEHKGLELCAPHYMAWRAGTPWGPGGLELERPPRQHVSVGWRSRGLKLAGIANYIMQRTCDLRVYPDGTGGFTADRAAWDGTPGYWRYNLSKDNPQVVVLPAVTASRTEAEHWGRVRAAHTQIRALKELENRIRVEVRDPALVVLLPYFPSNAGLSELAGVGDQVIWEMRHELRTGTPVPGKARKIPA